MDIRHLGEFGLIDKINQLVSVSPSPSVVGIGDDCAVWKISPDKLSLVTTDMLVENTHFSRTYSTAYQVGWKTMACNISDIAAMSGIPQYAVVSLGLPPDTDVEWILELYRGMKELADKYLCTIVGGDTVSAPWIVINIALYGVVEEKSLCLRSGAHPGDVVMVTGDLGSAGAGLKVLQNNLDLPYADRDYLLQRHLMPVPRIDIGRYIGSQSPHGAATDSSDGLARDILNISKSSQVGFRINLEDIPIHSATQKVARILSIPPYELALSGGEDYELVFTMPEQNAVGLARTMEEEFNCPIRIIGKVLPSEEGIQYIDNSGNKIEIPTNGYDHFNSR